MIIVWLFRLLLLGVMCLSVFPLIHAETTGTIEGGDVTVQYDEPLRNAAMEVVERYPRIKQELEGVLGWEIDFRMSIVLIRDSARFQGIVSNPYIIAFAVPDKHLIVLDYSKMNINPFTLEVTLKHELCHIILGTNIPDDRLPRWLNEGFCQWVTGGIAELMIDSGQPTLSKASLSSQLIPLASLRRSFPSDRDRLILAYEESKSVVDYMVMEYGWINAVKVLDHLKKGDTIDEATGKVLSVTTDELEKRWIQYLRGQVTWMGYLASNIYTILLFAAAVLTVCGFVRVIAKRRHEKTKTDEDEEEVDIR